MKDISDETRITWRHHFARMKGDRLPKAVIKLRSLRLQGDVILICRRSV
jgi:hypothetical protein